MTKNIEWEIDWRFCFFRRGMGFKRRIGWNKRGRLYCIYGMPSAWRGASNDSYDIRAIYIDIHINDI